MDDSEPDKLPGKQEGARSKDTVDAVPFFGKLPHEKKSGHEKTEPVAIAGGEHIYSMNRKTRGVAVIICNSTFDKMNNRVGADKDSSKIYQTLSGLGFEPRLRQNLKEAQMKTEIEKVAKEDHTNADSFVCVVMSHGDSQGIYGTDCKPVSIKELAALFKGDKCRSLVGKPKMFFVQACRGQLLDSGVEVTDGGKEVTDAPFKFLNLHRKKKKMPCSVPTSADFLMSYSTFDDHFAFLNKKNGSVYIQRLAEELDKCDGTTEICTVLQRVTQKVAFQFVSNANDPEYTGKKQCPVYTSTLTKQLYLTKKK